MPTAKPAWKYEFSWVLNYRDDKNEWNVASRMPWPIISLGVGEGMSLVGIKAILPTTAAAQSDSLLPSNEIKPSIVLVFMDEVPILLTAKGHRWSGKMEGETWLVDVPFMLSTRNTVKPTRPASQKTA
jgi:hypothetical protein